LFSRWRGSCGRSARHSAAEEHALKPQHEPAKCGIELRGTPTTRPGNDAMKLPTIES
jgi:hypothetical protein